MSKKQGRVTVRRINEAVHDLGYRGVELVRGRGYYYWSGGISARFSEQGVYGSPHLGALTLRQWVNDFKSRVADVRRTR